MTAFLHCCSQNCTSWYGMTDLQLFRYRYRRRTKRNINMTVHVSHRHIHVYMNDISNLIKLIDLWRLLLVSAEFSGFHEDFKKNRTHSNKLAARHMTGYLSTLSTYLLELLWIEIQIYCWKEVLNQIKFNHRSFPLTDKNILTGVDKVKQLLAVVQHTI